MSRGSTLTLYRKLNIEMKESDFLGVIKKYSDYNEKHDYFKQDKNKSDYENDIPEIMCIDAFRKESKYDKKKKVWVDLKKPFTIKNAKDYYFGYVAKADKCYCEKMMEWNFGSSFDCVVDKFNLSNGSFKNSCMIITPSMAKEMLSAIDYILSGDWKSNKMALSNTYVNLFTGGYNCLTYYKYTLRNNIKTKNFNIKKDGYEISIKCPVQKKNAEDEAYDSELNESNEEVEYYLNTFRNGLTAYLCSNNWDRHDDNDDSWLGYDNKYKFVLTYEYWG